MKPLQESNKSQTACFTGHRNIEKEQISIITKNLETVLHELVAQGVKYFGSGGAYGFDQLSGFAVLGLKKQYPHIKLIMVLPCKKQEIKWPPHGQDKYRALLEVADKKVWLSEEYDHGCMLRRNRHLVENSGFCVAYMRHGGSGTAQTVRLARERGLTVINIADL